MRVVVNGVPSELPAGATVADVVVATCASPRGIAVAVDREVVPRSRWEGWAVQDGSRIEIVEAAAGG